MKFKDLGETAEIIADTVIDWYDGFDFAYVKDELTKLGNKPLTMWINSPGGNVFAAAEVYTALKEYPGEITAKIPAIAASAATIIAMAADKIYMSPPAMFMIHRPSTIAWGNTDAMEEAINLLQEIESSMIETYHAKTGIAKETLAEMLNEEYWMSSSKALEQGFIDGILIDEPAPQEEDPPENKVIAYDFKPSSHLKKVVASLSGYKPEPPAKPEPVDTANLVEVTARQKDLAMMEIQQMKFGCMAKNGGNI